MQSSKRKRTPLRDRTLLRETHLPKKDDESHKSSAFRPFYGKEPKKSQKALSDIYQIIAKYLSPEQLELAMKERQRVYRLDTELELKRSELSTAKTQIKTYERKIKEMQVVDKGEIKTAKQLKRELGAKRMELRSINLLLEETQLNVQTLRVENASLRSRRGASIPLNNHKREKSRDSLSFEEERATAALAEEVSLVKNQLKSTTEELKNVRMERNNLQMNLEKLEDEHKFEEREWEQASIHHQNELNILQTEVENLQFKLDKMKKNEEIVKDENIETEDLRHQLTIQKAIIHRLESTNARAKEHEDLIKDLKERNKVLSTNEQRLKSALNFKSRREEQHSIEKRQLEQENLDLLQKVVRLKDNTHNFEKLQVDHNNLKNKVAEWEQCFGDTLEFQSPVDIARRLNELHTETENLSSTVGKQIMELQRIKAVQKMTDKLKEQLMEELEKKCGEAHAAIEDAKKHKMWRGIFERERNTYKELLDSYNAEDAVGHYDELKTERIQALEKTLSDREERVTQLETQIDSLKRTGEEMVTTPTRATSTTTKLATESPFAPSSPYRISGKIIALQKQVDSLNNQLEEMGAEIEKLVEENTVLKERIGESYDPLKTKVIHLVNNPARDIIGDDSDLLRLQKQNKSLQEENEKLWKNIEQFKIGGGGGKEGRSGYMSDIIDSLSFKERTSSLELDELRVENKKLQSEVDYADKLYKRWKEIAKKEIDTLRGAVYELLGYRIDMMKHEDTSMDGEKNKHVKRFRLTSIYSPKNDFFLFQQEPDSLFTMLGTDLATREVENVTTYLEEGESIPAFLSAFTLEQFNCS